MIEVELMNGARQLINLDFVEEVWWRHGSAYVRMAHGGIEVRGTKERLRKVFMPDAMSEITKPPRVMKTTGIEKGESVV